MFDQIRSKYIESHIFKFLKPSRIYDLTRGKKYFFDNKDFFDIVFKPARFHLLLESVDINWLKYSEVIYATVEFIANEICSDYAKALNNGFPSDLKKYSDFVKSHGLFNYNDSLEKNGAEYFNKTVKPHAIRTIIYLLLMEITDLKYRKKLFSEESLSKYLTKHSGEKLSNTNEYFNNLICCMIYQSLEMSLKDTQSKLKESIDYTLYTMATLYISNEAPTHGDTEDKIFRKFLETKSSEAISATSTKICDFSEPKIDSHRKTRNRFIANLNNLYWYIKMRFKQDRDGSLENNAKSIDGVVSDFFICFFTYEYDIVQKVYTENRGSLYELLKKDASFSFLFQDKDEEMKKRKKKYLRYRNRNQKWKYKNKNVVKHF